jgi:predicted metal-dependent HD superfamily phosphohydrolase
MVCAHCLAWAFCDEWQLKFEWNAWVPLAPSDPLPRFILPRARLVHAVRWGAILSRAESVDGDAFASEPAVRALCDVVSDAWSEPHRRYHSLQHLSECLRWLDDPALDGALARPLEVELALFFHDLVYDTTRSDNEEVSAERAVALLSAVDGADGAAIERVRAMILATRSHVADTDDARLMLDVDLSILGADERRFAEYEQQIREEYHWVPDDAYRAGRRRVLEGFAERGRIFQTPIMFERLEARAKDNLARALAR